MNAFIILETHFRGRGKFFHIVQNLYRSGKGIYNFKCFGFCYYVHTSVIIEEKNILDDKPYILTDVSLQNYRLKVGAELVSSISLRVYS